MKILFIHPTNYGYWIPMGIASLSAYLNKNGHETAIYDTTRKEFSTTKEELNEKILQFNPGLIAVSCISADFHLALQIADFIKRHHKIDIVFGGVHATIDPENVISNPNIDMICIGEGEIALLELVNKMESGREYFDTLNFWFKKHDIIIKNPVRPLIEELDSLPFPDRELFDEKHVLVDDGISLTIPFIAGRGCPFNCPYCINSTLKEMYRGKGRYVRLKTVEYLIAEIKEVLNKYTPAKPTKISFFDDTFTLNKKWMNEFCEIYRKEIGFPFTCLTRVDTISEEVLLLLKKAGCVTVEMSIETGNMDLRNKVLNRSQTNDQIISAFELARKVGLKTMAFNMVGLPYETKETIRDTINLTKKANPDYKQAAIFQPYKGLPLRDLCIEKGYIKKDDNIIFGVHSISSMNLPEISRYDIIKAHDLFDLYVDYPYYLYSLFDFVYYAFYHINQRDKITKLLYILDIYKKTGLKNVLRLAYNKINHKD